MQCNKCGKEVSEGKFCPECGTKFAEENGDGKDVKVTRKSKKKLLKYLGIGVLVYVIATVIIAILTGGVDDSETRTETYIEEVKEGDNAEIQEEVSSQSVENEDDFANGLTFDLNTDIENSLLHSDGNGHIVDIDGNIIPEYSYITVLDNGCLSDGECVLEGYGVARNGQIERTILDDSVINSESSLTAKIGLRSGQYKNPKSQVVITIPDQVYSDGESAMFVYVPIYIGTIGNEYAYEYSGMINLFDIGTITIMTGIQDASWLEYDYEKGYIGEASSLIGDALGYDYDVDGVTKFYLDGFAPETLSFIGKSGTYACTGKNGYEGQVSVYPINSEEVEITISSLRSDNVYFTYGGYSKITDKDTAVFSFDDSKTIFDWVSDGTIKITQNGEYLGLDSEEIEAIDAVIGQTFEFVSSEYVGW